MEFHGIDSQGEIFIQRVVSLPAWAASDEGRLLYVGDSAALSYGTNVEWVHLTSFGAGTRVWFHQDTAPIGWSIVAGLGDRLLAVKGGSQAYNIAGGGAGGTWIQPNHLHTTGNHKLTILEMPSHNHTPGTTSAGAHEHTLLTGTGQWTEGDPTGIESDTNVHRTSNKSGFVQSGGAHTHPVTSQGGGATHNHGSTGNNATASTYRQSANVGIVAEKD